jgi:hypothetical protein
LIQNGFKDTLEKVIATKQGSLKGVLSEIEKERVDPELDERERLTEKQANLMRQAIQKQTSTS